MGAIAAEPLKLLLLQNAEQFRLQFQGDVADFVKKQRASVPQFKSSDFLRNCSGERSFFVAEQLALKKPKRNSRAVQFDKGTLPPAAEIPTDQLPLFQMHHPITKYLVCLNVFSGSVPVPLPESFRWQSFALLRDLPMPSPHRRAVEAILEIERK